jgi:hypothetical protein
MSGQWWALWWPPRLCSRPHADGLASAVWPQLATSAVWRKVRGAGAKLTSRSSLIAETASDRPPPEAASVPGSRLLDHLPWAVWRCGAGRVWSGGRGRSRRRWPSGQTRSVRPGCRRRPGRAWGACARRGCGLGSRLASVPVDARRWLPGPGSPLAPGRALRADAIARVGGAGWLRAGAIPAARHTLDHSAQRPVWPTNATKPAAATVATPRIWVSLAPWVRASSGAISASRSAI